MSRRRLRPALPIKLTDADAEAARRNVNERVDELQSMLFAGVRRPIRDVSLADGVATHVPHGLGRAPDFVTHSPPRGPATSGRIEEVRDGTFDAARVVVLKATGYGATVLVDVVVA